MFIDYLYVPNFRLFFPLACLSHISLIIPLHSAKVHFSVMPCRVTLEQWCQLDIMIKKWEEDGENEEVLMMVKDVYNYIDSLKEIGASVNDLKVQYHENLLSSI